MNLNIVIVLPTYNESGNILRLLKEIKKQQVKLKNTNLFILVVDDKSPDGTAAIVKKYSATNPNVYLLSGKKQGLGVAYIRGFDYAIKKLKADVVFEMDADFSHNPNDIPRFVKKIQEGNDFVIGSRYIKGGSIPENWPLIRKLNSKVGNIFARYVAGLGDIKDCTSGFRAINTKVFTNIPLASLNAAGYAFQINVLHEAVEENYIISEIPISFANREVGVSKLQIKDITEFLKYVLTIHFSHLLKRTKILLNGRLNFYQVHTKEIVVQ